MDKPLAEGSAEMAVDKDAPIPVRDGAILRANIFRPGRPGKYPVIMSMGIYGKDVHFADAYKPQWEALKRLQPALHAAGPTARTAGAPRLRRHRGRCAGQREIAGLSRSFCPPGSQRRLGRARVGRRAG